MLLDELLKLISEKIGNEIRQSLLAEALGITRQTVSNRIKNESEVTVSELNKIEKFFEISILGNKKESKYEDIVEIDYYNDVFASCGGGSIVFSDEKIKMALSTLLIDGFSKQKLYSVINASGNSMSPTIDNGDKLIHK